MGTPRASGYRNGRKKPKTIAFIMAAITLALAICIWLGWWQANTLLMVKKDDLRSWAQQDRERRLHLYH